MPANRKPPSSERNELVTRPSLRPACTFNHVSEESRAVTSPPYRRPQLDHTRHELRVLVAHLDPQPLRAREDVLAAQEVERALGAAELVASRHRARLGGEAVHREALLAVLGGAERLVVQVAAVEA